MFYIQNYRDILQWPAFLTLLVGLIYPVPGVKAAAAEARLHSDLFQMYNADVRPVLNVSDVVNVKLGLSIISIRNVDMENGVLDMISWVDLEWNDPQLQWDPSKYGNLRTITVSNDLIWTPDISMFNVITPLDSLQPVRPRITHNGDISVNQMYRSQTNGCGLDLDGQRQFCYVKFLSWTYDGYQVDLKPKKNEADLYDYIYNRNWEITYTNVSRNEIYYPCCPESFPDIKLEIGLAARRKNGEGTVSNFSSKFFPMSPVLLTYLVLLSVFCFTRF